MRPLRSRGLAALELWDEPDWSAFTFARFLNSDRHISTLLFLPFFGAAVDIPPPPLTYHAYLFSHLDTYGTYNRCKRAQGEILPESRNLVSFVCC